MIKIIKSLIFILIVIFVKKLMQKWHTCKIAKSISSHVRDIQSGKKQAGEREGEMKRAWRADGNKEK